MWFFSPLNDQNQECGKILLCPNQEYTISRKVGDIVIQSDHSISRNHAVLKVDGATKRSVYNKKFKPPVLLENIKAKFGTFVNGKKLETALYLYDGDVVRFGALKSYFRLKWIPVVVCVSSMSSVDKHKVAECAASLGIQLKKEWDHDCTHLYMKEIDDTANFMLCLTHGKPIISLGWFDALMEMGKTIEFTWPSTNEYLPPIRNECKNVKPEQCLPNKDRASLFNGLEFWFFDEPSYNTYQAVVQAAGGQVKYCSMNRTYTIDAVTEDKRIIVAPENDRHAVFREIKAKLKDRHRRCIESHEIVTALIECSTNNACNPRLPQQHKEHEDDLFDIDDPLSAQSDMHRSPSHARDVTQASTTTPSALDDMFDDILGDDDDDPLPPPSQQKKTTTSQPDRTMESSQSVAANPSSTTTLAARPSSPNETITTTTSTAEPASQSTLSRNAATTTASGISQQPRDTSNSAENSRQRNTQRQAKVITPTCQLVVQRSSQQRTRRQIEETSSVPINTKRFRKETDVGNTQLMERLVHMRTGNMNYSGVALDDEEQEGGDPFSDIRIRVARVSTSSRRGRR